MAKKVASVTLHKKKPIKHTRKRKKIRPVFKKILDYLKSDSYMFAPLLSSTTSFNAEEYDYELISENKKKRKKQFLWDLEDYLKSDCYLYAPLITRQPWLYSSNDPATPPRVCREKADACRHIDQMNKGSEEPTALGGNAVNILKENRHGHGYSPSRTTVVKHVLVQQATVKHRVQRNCSSFAPGEMHAGKEKNRIVVE